LTALVSQHFTLWLNTLTQSFTQQHTLLHHQACVDCGDAERFLYGWLARSNHSNAHTSRPGTWRRRFGKGVREGTKVLASTVSSKSNRVIYTVTIWINFLSTNALLTYIYAPMHTIQLNALLTSLYAPMHTIQLNALLTSLYAPMHTIQLNALLTSLYASMHTIQLNALLTSLYAPMHTI
jgi:hypothetical protein